MPLTAGSCVYFPPASAFPVPYALAVYGHRLWVANAGGDSVTAVSTATGRRIATYSGRRYRFNNPYALTVSDEAGSGWPTPAAGR